MSYSEAIAEKVNRLLARNIDMEKSYRVLLEQLKKKELHDFFARRVEERYGFGHELRSVIRENGEKPQEESTLAGDVSRGWMNLKRIFFPEKPGVLLEEVERQEKNTLEDYREVLNERELPDSIAVVLRGQKKAMETGLEELKVLMRKF